MPDSNMSFAARASAAATAQPQLTSTSCLMLLAVPDVHIAVGTLRAKGSRPSQSSIRRLRPQVGTVGPVRFCVPESKMANPCACGALRGGQARTAVCRKIWVAQDKTTVRRHKVFA